MTGSQSGNSEGSSAGDSSAILTAFKLTSSQGVDYMRRMPSAEHVLRWARLRHSCSNWPFAVSEPATCGCDFWRCECPESSWLFAACKRSSSSYSTQSPGGPQHASPSVEMLSLLADSGGVGIGSWKWTWADDGRFCCGPGTLDCASSSSGKHLQLPPTRVQSPIAVGDLAVQS